MNALPGPNLINLREFTQLFTARSTISQVFNGSNSE